MSYIARCLLLGCLPCLVTLSHGQSNRQLPELRREAELRAASAKTRVENFLKRHPSLVRNFTAAKDLYVLVDVVDNHPLYIKSENAEVATSLSVDEVRTGGSLGINLTGKGIRLGSWDAGKVKTDHVELTGRVTIKDGTSTLSDHATHTSGTMIASGVNPLAKGMAPEATLDVYDFTNDVVEMTGVAKPDQTSMLLSNHSYGTTTGWGANPAGGNKIWYGDPSISNTEDYKFGFYDTQSAQWDAITSAAPWYLIVKSAGNDRGETGPGPQPTDCAPNGYDCLPTFSVAKNILTVGAVEELTNYTGPVDVVMSSFSGWGPTDDGRIKPDIVAPGVNVLSTLANGGYGIASGTSMSAPAVTGTLALMQSLYNRFHPGQYMTSATMKAIVIHTAREAGSSTGPDYQFGWGLLDAEGCAKIILDYQKDGTKVLDDTLTNGTTFTLPVSIKPGFKITATLVWTDPAGTGVARSLDPTTRMLVNDLDLRVVGTGTFLPWILDPNNPSNAPTAGDNIRDNVEKVEVFNPAGNSYNITVSHKGTLRNGSQRFSLVVTYEPLADQPATYYWIGGTGNWNDPAHWSLTSGGTSAGLVPDATINVQVDENSFTADNQSITLTGPQACRSLRWITSRPASLSFQGNQLDVQGSLELLTDLLSASTPGTLRLSGSATGIWPVIMGSNDLSAVTIVVDRPAVFNVNGSPLLHELSIDQGDVRLNAVNLKVNVLHGANPASAKLQMISSTIQGVTALNADFTNLTFVSDTPSILLSGASTPSDVNLGTADFNGLVNIQGAAMHLTGTGDVRSIQGNGILTLSGALHILNLNLTGGSQMVFDPGTTHTFSKNFFLSTAAASRVAITASAAASMDFDGYYKICLDFVDVQRVNVTGPTIVTAGTGSTISNASNWQQIACADVLFPDFDIKYPCEGASVYFIDKSTGPVTARSWDFGDPLSSDNVSSLTNPLHYYEQPGSYSVSLTVDGTGGPLTANRSFTLQPNVLPANSVTLKSNGLNSDLLANSYQWVKDGQLISGATARNYVYHGQLGTYAVLTFDASCNRRSSIFLVTAIDDSAPSTSLKVYPVPASLVLQFEAPGVVDEVVFTDAMGRSWLAAYEPMNEGRYRVALGGIPAGVFMISVKTDSGWLRAKAIIH